MNKQLLDRFLRYVKVDTESVPDVEQFPSSEKQKKLLNMLADELRNVGVSVRTDGKYGYVYATIPSNCNGNYKLGFISHVDTSSAVSGKDVKPQVIPNYDGGDVAMAQGRVLSPKDYPSLLEQKGKTLICSDGNTLLGADDKAGCAVIMQMAEFLMQNPQIPHGEIRIAFTPDEEVGRGTDFFDVKGFDADGAYTVDGGGLGELEYENFNAASAKITFIGKSVHPGSAKGIMINANLLLAEFQSMLPVFQNPMYTEGYEGFYFLESIHGDCEKAIAHYIVRDHDRAKFEQKKSLLLSVADFINTKYGAQVCVAEIVDSYFNMKEQILPHIHLVDNAMASMRKAGVNPVVSPIRGGTDGARLSYEGLPCPNLFTGGHNFHGRYEYVTLDDMEKSLQTVLNLVDIYKDFAK